MAISFTDWNNQELRHYGIPGMRKGVRRDLELYRRRQQMMSAQRQQHGDSGVIRDASSITRGSAQDESARRQYEAQMRAQHRPDQSSIDEAIARAKAEGEKRAQAQIAERQKAAAAQAQQEAQKKRSQIRTGGNRVMKR